MKGKHHIIVETKRLKYEFDIRRNITVVQGDSATGKTTLIDLISEYASHAEGSGVRITSDVPCVVFAYASTGWESALSAIQNSIVFIDEDHSFMFSSDFARIVEGSSNYYVLITRKPLYNLPYSISEVYGIRTTGKYHFPEQVYHEFYHIYDDVTNHIVANQYTFLLEDEKAGFEFYKNAFGDQICRSSGGNTKLPECLRDSSDEHIVVIADGAAFGAYVEKLFSVAKSKQDVMVYFPESFEWLILKSGVVREGNVETIMNRTEEYINSEEFFSWERFFTALLQHVTEHDPIKKYSKLKLADYYIGSGVREAIIKQMPEEIRKLAK